MIDAETLERITAALDGGASKASVCRTFKVPRSTLLGTLCPDRLDRTGQNLTEHRRVNLTADTPCQLALMSTRYADRLTRPRRTNGCQKLG